jgi:hypothetical protein
MGCQRFFHLIFLVLLLAVFLQACSSGEKAGRDSAGQSPADALAGREDAPPEEKKTDVKSDRVILPDGPAKDAAADEGSADWAVKDVPGAGDGGQDAASGKDVSGNDVAAPGKDVIPSEDGTGKDGSAQPDGVAAPPTFAAEMIASDRSRFFSRSDNGGAVGFGLANANAADNAVAELYFHGDPALGPSDKLSPDYATEIGTDDGTFRYGTYRTRVQLARCAANEELVNGIFTYFNDGKDHDGDGLVDNSEIDIEILCSDPSIISLTVWTEYTSDAAGKNRHVSRMIRTKTGDYEDTRDYDTVIGNGSNPDFKQPGFPDPEAFYEMGFEWHAGSIRYFMVLGGKEVTLWTLADAKDIPTLAAPFLFNVWHSEDWWNSKGAADYPASDAVMRVDWFRYWKE